MADAVNAGAFFQSAPNKQTAFSLDVVTGHQIPVQYVVLAKDTTFHFEDGSYRAKAGFVLYENGDDDDDDGYTVVPPTTFFQRHSIP
jgi:hypothetical protein